MVEISAVGDERVDPSPKVARPPDLLIALRGISPLRNDIEDPLLTTYSKRGCVTRHPCGCAVDPEEHHTSERRNGAGGRVVAPYVEYQGRDPNPARRWRGFGVSTRVPGEVAPPLGHEGGQTHQEAQRLEQELGRAVTSRASPHIASGIVDPGAGQVRLGAAVECE